jgi:peptide/nickel transport system substrate-binding protein
MTTRRTKALVAGAAALSLLVSACGSDDGDSTTEGDGAKSGAAAYGAAENGLVNASDKTGGTLKYVYSDAPDSMDPGDTYYAYNWNFTRLYARPLTTFKQAAGKAGLELVPDLAEGLGEPSADGKTWTYKLKKGITYEDGTPVTSKDVKYAIARSNYTDELVNGPKYFQQYLAAEGYKGPYKDKNLDNFKGIETPDDTTIVFKLNQPFSEFDFLVGNPQSAPVPQAKDTGLKYQEHPLSTGPYKFENYAVGKSLALVKNDKWDASTDTNRKQLVDRIEVQMKVDATDIDQRLLAGTADLDLGGTGVQAQARATLLQDEAKKKNADNPQTGFLRYAMISTQVKPFDNIECRKAVLYAADHEAIQAAWGGEVGGDIATTVLPPPVVGYKEADTYGFLDDKNGNVEKAKEALTKCGQPNGFTTKIAVRGDRPKDVASGEAIQQSLEKIGIKTTIQKYPSGDWSAQYGGNPKFVHANNLGIMVAGWGPDWPSGFGFLSQLVDGRAIKANGGNYNQMELNDASVNALLDKGIQTTDINERNDIWAQVDEKVMASAAILPFVYEKTLLYRGPDLTNVFVAAPYGMYDYTSIGKSK